MTARAGFAGRVAAVGTITSAALLVASACTPGPVAETEVSFGIVSGDVVAGPSDDATVNLVVVAPQNDPVWTELREVSVTNEEDGSAVVLAGNDVGLIPGTARDGMQTGSLNIDIDRDVDAFSLGDVTLTFDGRDPLTYDAGVWRFTRVESDDEVTPVGDYPASMESCDDLSATFETPSGEDLSVVDIRTDSPGVTISGVESQRDGDAIQVSADLTCDDTADFYTVTPRVVVEHDRETIEHALDPILIGYLDIAPEVVERIAAR